MFIVFEGIDGVGKSTLMNQVAIALSNKVNQDVHLTRFPKRNSDRDFDPRKLLFSNQYTRAAIVNYQQMITYSLSLVDNTDYVLADRWVYSSWAYQWRMGNVPLHTFAFDNLAKYIAAPDLLVYCHAPLPICRYRVIFRDGLGSPDLDFLTEHNYNELRAGYNIALSTKIGGKCPKKVLSLDTSGNIEDLLEKVLAEISTS